jgi:hypothetical protein
MFEYITTRILHTPLGKRVDELVSWFESGFPKVSLAVTPKSSQLAKAQALDSPDQEESPPRSPSLSEMLNEMAIHSRRIQDRTTPDGPRPHAAVGNCNSVPPSLPPQETIIHSLYATPPSLPDYNMIASNHRFPQNAIRGQQRPSRRSCRPPPAYSEADPDPSTSVTLSEMGLSVRGDLAPQLPPPYSSLPTFPPTRGDD